AGLPSQRIAVTGVWQGHRRPGGNQQAPRRRRQGEGVELAAIGAGSSILTASRVTRLRPRGSLGSWSPHVDTGGRPLEIDLTPAARLGGGARRACSPRPPRAAGQASRAGTMAWRMGPAAGEPIPEHDTFSVLAL